MKAACCDSSSPRSQVKDRRSCSGSVLILVARASFIVTARGRIERYLKFPVSWVYGEDIARGCILALDKGVSGERYMLDGRPEDIVSIANACNRIGQLAGLDHEVVDIEPSDDPELAKVFGPTLVAIAEKAAKAKPDRRKLEDSKTYKRLGYSPISLDEGLATTLDWFKAIGKLGKR